MLNFDVKDKALKELKEAIERHESVREQVKQISVYLFEQRLKVASTVIKAAEAYVNILANSPKEFDQAVFAFRYQVNCFRNTIHELERTSNVSTSVAASGAAGGVAAGVGVAAFAPTAAMAIATTFGTASTGTAIASLSGAAATNAALAWLGGGAIAAGGGGMAAGNAVLAMAGPVGWTIGGVALVGSGVFMNMNNAKIAEEATEKKYEILSEIYSLTRVGEEIKQLSQKTKKLADACLATIKYLQGKAPKNYTQLSPEQRELLGQLINCIRSLGQLLNTQTVL